MMDGRKGFHVFSRITIFGRRWYWHARAGNSEIVANGEAYNSRAAAYDGIIATSEIFGVEISGLSDIRVYEKNHVFNVWGGRILE
jgi:hypothetical protein